MAKVQKFRRKHDGVILEAFQYGEGNPWDPAATTRVAAFVTGIDVDSQTTIRTEHVLDVVQPILTEWDMGKNKAPIEIAQGSGRIRLDLGDWVVRNPNKTLLFVKEDAFADQYDLLHEIRPGEYMSVLEIESEKLSDFIFNECMKHLEGDLYQALAENIAGKLVRAGWRKEES